MKRVVGERGDLCETALDLLRRIPRSAHTRSARHDSLQVRGTGKRCYCSLRICRLLFGSIITVKSAQYVRWLHAMPLNLLSFASRTIKLQRHTEQAQLHLPTLRGRLWWPHCETWYPHPSTEPTLRDGSTKIRLSILGLCMPFFRDHR